MVHDVFDVYVAAIDDTNQINTRRQSIDSLYTTIVTLILTGDVYVAITSGFRTWFGAITTAAIMVAGLSVIMNWRRAQRELDEILDVRYEFLRNLEKQEAMQTIGATLVTLEYVRVYQNRASRKTAAKRLQRSFSIMFIAIALAMALLTFASTSALIGEWMPWLQQAIRNFSPSPQP
jgi:hypothetical protein